jgi:hypothetical protein
LNGSNEWPAQVMEDVSYENERNPGIRREEKNSYETKENNPERRETGKHAHQIKLAGHSRTNGRLT